jgi:hypothetical protein
METSRTFSNVLEKFQKKRKDLVANLIPLDLVQFFLFYLFIEFCHET